MLNPELDGNWVFSNTQDPCPSCNESIRRMRRDDQIIDVLQQARFILSSSTVPLDPAARLERAKLAINEAMRLMQPVRW